MTADLLPFPRHAGGRPSKATLAALTEARDEALIELSVAATERAALAATVLALVARARRALHHGDTPVRLLDELEQIARQEATRAAAMTDESEGEDLAA